MQTITIEDHVQLFEGFEAGCAVAFNGPMDAAWERSVDSIGNPCYKVNESLTPDQEVVDWLNACFIGFCIAKGFIGKFEEN